MGSVALRSMVFVMSLLYLPVGGLAPGGLVSVLGGPLDSAELRDMLVRVSVGRYAALR